ncbi:peptide-methionine (S)-S-oxide reductase MsrA [Schaalia sp. 19OD2882]|uniref:peptide-methionine (S)-S-oxide reductase MsrA n=1 Tax=Schaalia sp. 19OD2882 TaxID=2794089 RepID=UPI001C1EEF42|nr:peptide-methionine (S)-S-oxide reductase MsrA [Schaalia sp. 19OD2882]QWW19674.1 peptide-methionine (S)-S-oxide reductase MsrA [Schaalia sp. 19OD2882]
MSETRTITLAGGCFWGTEKLFSLVRGVTNTQVGYANGPAEGPVTYEQVCAGSGHAEAVRVDYDPQVVSLATLVDLFFDTIDPFAVNRQGNDRGVQYRSGIYVQDQGDLAEVAALVAALEQRLGASPVATEVAPLRNFHPAEDHHQDYLDKNPLGYCHLGPAAFAKAKAI